MVNTLLESNATEPRPRRWRALGMAIALVLATMLASTAAFAQPIRITGTVQSTAGSPLRGVIVRALGTDSVTTTNDVGRYQITALASATLSFTYIGHRPMQEAVNGRTTIDVRMERIAVLDQVVVTAYSEEQRRSEITGAVASVNVEAASRQTSASVLQRLDATVSGVTVDASGSPGGRSTVRIRGISSFQNNDPLYIVDGTPVQDSYINWLNPNDIASIQVLKDASAASIYGARASNGVVIIETTKRGQGAPRANFRARTGLSNPVRGYDDFLILNSLDYFEIVKRSYDAAGQPVPTNIYGSATNPTVPGYIWPNNCGAGGASGPCNTLDESAYSYPNSLIMPASDGTNWWDAVFGTGFVGDYNLDVSGGGADNTYFSSFNFFDQKGTAAYNRFNRGSIRVNSSFRRGKLSFGENMALAAERAVGGVGNDGFGEGGILGKNILSQPIVPVYDVNGYFASGKAVGLGNNTNPLKVAYAARNNIFRNNRVFGNIFGAFDLMAPLVFRSQFGFNLGTGTGTGYNAPTPENAEPNFANSIFDNSNRFTEWTWSNTLRYNWNSGARHNLSVLAGQEANRNIYREINASQQNTISEDPNSQYIQPALGGTRDVTSGGNRSSLLSYFAKADYTLLDRYTATATVRRDGSSRLGPESQWGTFPAFGLGWRLSQEPFWGQNRVLNDVMLRFGYGVTGNQNIPAGRIVSQFGGSPGDTGYDIGGTDGTIQPGYRETSLGNANLKWEENQSINVGADMTFFNGLFEVVADLYERNTENLLFDPAAPGTAGVAAAPIVNIGKMRNRGIDLSISHRAPTWSVTLNGAAYRNEIVRIDGVQDFFYGPISTRFGNQVINKIGNPIGSFYGYIADGLFRDAADVSSHATQAGAAPGRIKFRDVNGDGEVTLADRTIIGSPHPNFTSGLDFQWRRGAFDVASTIFGTFGNEIFDVQKEFYVFRNFSTNVRKELLTDSWTPENPGAKYPRLDVNDVYSYALSSFYVEDGSYVRLRNLQIGYALPPTLARWTQSARLYLQGENLFTITGYDGLDPSLPAANVNGAAGDIRDQYRGVDRGTYPSSRVFSFGLQATF